MTAQMIPAYNADGRLGPVEKLEVHRRGLRHPAISVFVRAGDEILLQQRAFGKYHTPGLWANTCCTHPHWGEDMRACALRRLQEELGITGLVLSPAGEIEYRADVGAGLTEHEVVQIFTAEATRDLPLALNPDEVASIRWMTPEALREAIRITPEAFTPWLRIYMDQQFAHIFS
ncbi:isopentenyl-diphosphate Delta-isomerase [Falsigemmobacter faecalis]|uniref:Isopentenyl-diphosphate Delta-isomerase n=1 Tax=Falsigemmobacter faecalis TaxID=2488730 RepID=A0A3P3E075_9RHOB|nr:isopentenyl-diphosphate Delta-isomerase [Falsigemmobacter faecalis]RRH78468.1 isopentenyl-diphosphate Delta-isomerase [Falsigemmobacter faecalis]